MCERKGDSTNIVGNANARNGKREMDGRCSAEVARRFLRRSFPTSATKTTGGVSSMFCCFRCYSISKNGDAE